MEALQHLPTVAMSAADGRANGHLLGPRDARFELQHRLPDYLCRQEMRRGELVAVLPGRAPPVGLVPAVYPSRRGMVPAVRRLLDFLGENMIGERIVNEG